MTNEIPPIENVTVTETFEQLPSVERERPEVPKPKVEHFGTICPNCGARLHGTLKERP